MGVISELSDELLIKILSYLPTKAAVSTSVLSKQWEFLWMWLPKLEFGSTHISDSEIERFQSFLLGNFSLHKAPVIESFCLKIPVYSHIETEDVKLLVQIAVSREVRELDVSYPRYIVKQDILPSSLYTCKHLVTLKLGLCTLVDVPPMVCLPSLKTLRLENVFYGNKETLQLLLSKCPVLEDLWIYGFLCGDMGKLIIMVPSLQRLSLHYVNLEELVIDTPSLKYLKLNHFRSNHLCFSDKNMPELREAFFEGLMPFFKRVIRLIPSVKSLTLCLLFDNMSEVVYDDGFVFNLKHLKLCICLYDWPDILVELLKISPNLRVLELFIMEDDECTDMHYWNQPSTVPESMLSSLETFKWSGYGGSKKERELAVYILQNARLLKTATFFLYYKYDLDKTHEMKTELELSARASTTCQLVFE